MNKYVVTVLMDGEYYPINVKAKDGLQAQEKCKRNIDTDGVKIVQCETRKEYNERTRIFKPMMTSSFQSVKTTKRAIYGE